MEDLFTEDRLLKMPKAAKVTTVTNAVARTEV